MLRGRRRPANCPGRCAGGSELSPTAPGAPADNVAASLALNEENDALITLDVEIVGHSGRARDRQSVRTPALEATCDRGGAVIPECAQPGRALA